MYNFTAPSTLKAWIDHIASIRVPSSVLILFERVVNAVHIGAPGTPIAFNTSPDDSVDAAARWLADT